jgi:hypothetical protein
MDNGGLGESPPFLVVNAQPFRNEFFEIYNRVQP